jgi:FkbM family methyltransferase
VSEGDVCLDLGANLGWFTTLLQGIVGPTGFVHAFEPVPATFDRLKRNILLNDRFGNVRANRVALGESVGEIKMIVDASEPDGHASVAFDNCVVSGTSVKADLSTLDIYLEENESREIAFLKADIEGSELPMLKGGLRLFEQEHAPIMEIEMARNTSLRFGYEPNDLISFINARRSYEYYRIDEFERSLIRFEEFGKEDIGANVLCIPLELPLEPRKRIGIGV